uniref:26S proteasome non-ATPase regulatory subunit 1/RPN2 N-terminal domain-containing protein n=1 Tax=Ditylenchus dipsaci TaxID=166011 RepID=A0A915D3X0_9BILA
MPTSSELDCLIDRVFERSLQTRDFALVIGLALDTSRLDVIKKAMEVNYAGNDKAKLLTALSSNLLGKLDESDHVTILQSLVKLERPSETAHTLATCSREEALAYQLAFHLHDCATQQFIGKVVNSLLNVDLAGATKKESVEKIQSILNGNESTRHFHQFLIRFLVKSDHTDIPIIGKIKDSIRTACTHNATLIANGLMHMGTTSDVFLRDNLPWISNATNWNKFNAVASLGLIHKGNEQNAQKVLEPYLPKEGEQDASVLKREGPLCIWSNPWKPCWQQRRYRHGASLGGLCKTVLMTKFNAVSELVLQCLLMEKRQG